jgi:hypothetical protein
MSRVARFISNISACAWACLATAVLLAVAANALLSPAMVPAKVAAKHAREYKAMVQALVKHNQVNEEVYNDYVDSLIDTAQNIQAILSHDPVDHDALVREEENAALLAKNMQTLVQVGPEQLEASTDYLYFHAKGWFRTDSDRIRFKRGTHNVSSAAANIQTAYRKLKLALDQLAVDPPNLGKAREYNEQANNAVKLANPKFTKGFADLKRLQR